MAVSAERALDGVRRTREGCALVTGASRGIGAAIGQALAADGWPVAVNYRTREDEARAVVGRIARGGGVALALPGDIAGDADLVAAAEEQLGPVAVLVNNAGVRADGLAVQLEDDDWDRVLETNLSAAFRLTRSAVKRMVRRRHGRVVNIASVVGPKANAGQANYAAAKAGLIAMTKTVAVEVARRGVTVNAVAPGFVATDMTEGLLERAVEAVPARRAGRPEDVAGCVRFLASDEAAYVTGTVLTVDGGLSA
jgi:3-oxoacyl-[acyl-carrier protein] reductase